MGDFNIDLLKFGSHNKISDYLDYIFSHGFISTIYKPTSTDIKMLQSLHVIF